MPVGESHHPGSSPLTRGKLVEMGGIKEAPGLIPAHAGKTWRSRTLAGNVRAHPRSRGENSVPFNFDVHALGSSPLTRGKPNTRIRKTLNSGLIPAHAGKTSKDVIGSPVLRAHPRSRGENAGLEDRFDSSSGSSPLTRGKRFRCADDRLDLGLIPAHAGKTRGHPGNSSHGQAHPRSRGENSSASYAA